VCNLCEYLSLWEGHQQTTNPIDICGQCIISIVVAQLSLMELQGRKFSLKKEINNRPFRKVSKSEPGAEGGGSVFFTK
jgi:hypothetical protein